MTRIYTVNELENSHIPSKEGLVQANLEANRILTDLCHKSVVLGATTYGSLAALNKSGHVTSDLDWLIVFKSLEDLADSEEIAEFIEWLKTLHLDFSNPIISLDSLEQENHIIGPILYSIRDNAERIVIGKDPLEMFDLKREKLLKVISNLFHTFTRYFYENLVHHPLTKKDLDVLVKLLQTALNFFLDSYRSMQVVHDDGEEALNYEKYLAYYQGRIKDEILQDGLRVNQFIGDYKNKISQVLENNDIDARNDYISFIKDSRDVIMSSARFCRGNIEFFRSKIDVQNK